MAGKPAEEPVTRRHKVLAQYLSPGGLGKHNSAEVARALRVSERTLWKDLKVVREQWAKSGAPVHPDAATVHARIGAALDVAWGLVREGEDAETALKALDRVYKGIDLQARVSGVYAPEKVEHTVGEVTGINLTPEDLAWFAHWRERWEELCERREAGTLTEMERHALDVFEAGL